MQASCQCGAVAFTTPTAKPLNVYHCHCTECRKQSASAFGTSAIFPAAPLFPLTETLRDKLSVWSRHTDAGNTLDCYFCKVCGVRVVHRVRRPDGREEDTISVKGGVLSELDYSGAIHIWVRSAVVPIPAGLLSWETEPE